MQIADNVLRYHLRNVYWLCGGACGGKSTISKILADKYDLLLYDCDDRWSGHQKLATAAEQPTMIRSNINWEEFFLQPVEDLVKWSHEGIRDQMSMVIIDLIRKVYFDRDHTQSMLTAIKATSEPDKVLNNVLNSIVKSSSEELNWAKDYKYSYFVRNSSTQPEDIQVFLEQHFGF